MRKFLLILGSFYLATVLLMPKTNLYYTLKHYLKQEHIVVTQQGVKDRWFDLKIEGMKIYYDGIESASLRSVTVWPWLLYNRIHATDVAAGKDLKKMFDFQASDVTISHTVTDPMHVHITAEGNFGSIEGSLDIKAGKLKLICMPTESFRRSVAFREIFRKTEEGFVHESDIR